jgi:hypothetical protein
MTANPKTKKVGKRIVVVMLICLFASGCKTGNPTNTSGAASAEPLYVVLDGPWVLAADPLDADKLVAISPKLGSHIEPYVEDGEGIRRLPLGVYEISISTGRKKAASVVSAANPPVLYSKVKRSSGSDIQAILGQKNLRYAVRLPLPDAYGSYQKRDSRIGQEWPVDKNGKYDEGHYTTAISFRYDDADLARLDLSGTPDQVSNVFQPGTLSVHTPSTLRLIVEAHDEDTGDPCSTQSKQAFVGVNGLFHLELYVDFPKYPKPCRDRDPQNPRAKPPINLMQALDTMESQIRASASRQITNDEAKFANEALELARIYLESSSTGLAAARGEMSVEAFKVLEGFFAKTLDRKSTREEREGALKGLVEVREGVRSRGPGGKDCKTAIFDVSGLIH